MKRGYSCFSRSKTNESGHFPVDLTKKVKLCTGFRFFFPLETKAKDNSWTSKTFTDF
jgi:hypothetical protein